MGKARKKLKRTFPKRWASTAVTAKTKGISQGRFRELYNSSLNGIKNRDEIPTTKIALEVLERAKLIKPPHRNYDKWDRPDPVPPRFRVAEQLERLSQSAFYQRIDTFNSLAVQRGRLFTLKLYFSGQIWFFIKEDYVREIATKSVIYPSRERAYSVMNKNKILWEAFTPLTNSKAAEVPPTPP